MRFHPTRGAMSLGESKGGLPPDSCTEDEALCLNDMERCIKEFHDNSRCKRFPDPVKKVGCCRKCHCCNPS